ncbi:MAG: hypothetical protein ACKO7W_20505 [Elainella sp.]
MNSSSTAPLFADSRLTSRSLAPTGLQAPRFGTRSRLEIGQFDRVFSSSGSVRRDFPDVFRFELTRNRRLRIYLGNEFSGSNSNRRMTVDLLDDRTLRRVTGVTINPGRIDAITRNLNTGTYRIRISTQSNDRGRYFLDMLRI